MPPKQRSAGDPSQPRRKPRGIRRDRDCVTCKARGLKCDLNRPQCLPCVQAGLACGGYALRVVWLDDRGRRSTAASTTAPSTSSVLPSTVPPAVPSTSSAPPLPSSAPPASLPTFSSLASFSPTPPFSTFASFSTASPPSTSSTTFLSAGDVPPNWGCSSPEDIPVSSPVAASPCCNSHTTRSPTPPSITTPVTAFPSIYRNPATGDESCCETDQNSLLMRLAALCSHLLKAEDAPAARTNQYLSLPETTGLLSDLCIFIQARLEGRNPPATQQQQQQQDGGPPEHAEPLDMVRHRLTALARVNRAIEAANPFAFLGIATFAVFEVCDTTFGEWQCHLHGARHLLDYHRCRSLADLQRLAAFVPGLMEILARLVWFDVSGSVVRGAATTPLIFDDWHRHALLDDEFFATVGLPADTCALYIDVAKARLARRPVQACLRAAEQVLRVEEPLPRMATTDHHHNNIRLSDWVLSANVNRCAAALAVLSQVQQQQQQQQRSDSEADTDAEDRAALEATTAAAVEKLCATLAATPASSRFYIHMAVGAYMAGMRARTREQCAVVRQYWLNCNISGISRYPGGLARCDEHWRRVGLLDEPLSLSTASPSSAKLVT